MLTNSISAHYWRSDPGIQSVGLAGRALTSLYLELGASGLVPLGAVA